MKTYVIYDNILPNSSKSEKCFRQICRENQNTHFIFNNLFFRKSSTVCEIIWKNVIETDGSQMTIHNSACVGMLGN